VNSLCDVASCGGPSFWTNRSNGYVLALLQDWVGEVGGLVERFRAILARIYSTMFPLNPAIEGLSALMKTFHSVRRIENLVRHQMIVGSHVALAFVRAHYPKIDMKLIGGWAPHAPPELLGWR
jgi:hypothetical protein